MDYEKTVEQAIKLRDKIKEIKDAHKEFLAPYMAAQDVIEAEVLKELDATGAKHIATDAGTLYKNTVTSMSIADKEMFLDFVKNNDAWTVADIRASKTGVVEYQDETGEVVPGLNQSTMLKVGIRRS